MKKAFSLVELSIVLVILGLLVGGILAGQSLIRASELRALTTEMQKFRTSMHAFRDKYFAVPGDMRNATNFWGSVGGNGSDADCQNTAATGLPTCNGNGDGIIDTSVVAVDETYRAWQHLANAGLIEGLYTGITGATSTNSYNSRAAGLYWTFATTGTTATAGGASGFALSASRGHGFHLARPSASVTVADSWPLRPEEAWNIDTKLDDGIPVTGNIISHKGNGTNTNCTTFAGVSPPGDAGATYLLSNTNRDCRIWSYRN